MQNLEERNLLIERYTPLAKKLARRKQKSLPNINLDEFVSAALMGLVDAASRYESWKGNFAPYARLRINGEILDYLRSLGFGSKGSVSRGCTQFSSLDAVMESGSPIISGLESRNQRDLRLVFDETVEGLDDEGKAILKLRFLEEQPLSEIGRRLGVSESRVSQKITQYKRQLAASAA